MQFPIWHWVILLLLIGVPVFFAVRSTAKPSQNPADLVGFGGWLMLLAIGQTLAPFRTLAELFSSSEGYQQLMTLPNGPLAVCGEIVLLLGFTLLQLVVLVAMLRRSPRFKQLIPLPVDRDPICVRNRCDLDLRDFRHANQPGSRWRSAGSTYRRICSDRDLGSLCL
ncbi:hypothetical protein [Mesorhizobium captivum]|uniref:hypothetical protein n=1 Tax=Mesorhizobium captivum TaxID=3072319 RepID=UPI002A24445E|nr:hypothetical protein [Mesorhizobium sp. VK3C]MDX8446717.1 hypothetical protein [Mesorhizobium sp. VK3C]